jgi:putative transposase
MFLCDLEGYTRRARRKPTLSIGQLEEQFRTFLIEIYHRTPLADAEISPSAKWEKGGFLPRMPESLEQLDLLLIEEVRSRRIRRDGIHFQGFRSLSLTSART